MMYSVTLARNILTLLILVLFQYVSEVAPHFACANQCKSWAIIQNYYFSVYVCGAHTLMFAYTRNMSFHVLHCILPI